MMNPTAGMSYPAQPPFAMAPYASPFWNPSSAPMPPLGVPVRTVWVDNLDAELEALRYFAKHAHCVAVSVHYPDVVHGTGQDHNLLIAEQRYAIVKANVDELKPLQVGITVVTRDGHLAAWEFNLSGFDLAADPCADHSVAYLAGRGLDIDAHAQHGVPVAKLTAALRGCGLIRRPGLTWIVYTGAYHAAYLIKIATGDSQLPNDLAGFLAEVRRCLGEDVYDVARLAGEWTDIPLGLERIASKLGLPKPLFSSQLAGAGSVMALQAYMALRVRYLPPGNDMNRHRGVLQGLQAL